MQVSLKTFKISDCVKVFETLSTLDPDPLEVNAGPQNCKKLCPIFVEMLTGTLQPCRPPDLVLEKGHTPRSHHRRLRSDYSIFLPLFSFYNILYSNATVAHGTSAKTVHIE